MSEWFDCYTPHANDKLGHDAILYLAEEGIRRLTTIAYSVYRARHADDGSNQEIEKRVGKPLTFGQRHPLLKECLGETQLWDLSVLDGTLNACGRLEAARNNLDLLDDSRSVDPVIAAIEDSEPARLSWWNAWSLIVDYRNRTLGHPSPNIVGSERFYEEMTPVVAAAVAEWLWNPTVVAVFERFPVARFDGLLEHNSYRVHVRNRDGYREPFVLRGPEGLELRRNDPVIVEVKEPRPLGFVSFERSPDGPHKAEPKRASVAPRLATENRQLDNTGSPPTADEKAEKRSIISYVQEQMVKALPGSFISTGAERRSYQIEISRALSVAVHPVTQELYEAVMGTRRGQFIGEGLPVEDVSWLDAVAFCNAFSTAVGLDPVYSIERNAAVADFSRNGVRLPTESEWEYCCLGGHTAEPYGPIDKVAWYAGNAKGRTHPVGELDPNGLGLYDMLGNVAEWCGDWFRKVHPYDSATDPSGPERGIERVLRGGSWRDEPRFITATARDRRSPEHRERTCGFRVVRTIDASDRQPTIRPKREVR